MMKSGWIATRVIKRWTVRLFFFFLACATIAHGLVLPIYYGSKKGGGFGSFPSFVFDLAMCAIFARLAFLYLQRSRRRERESEAAVVRFYQLRQMILEYREKTGAFPSSARELELVGASEEDIASAERDFLFTSRLDAGIVLASAKDLRVPHALPGFKTTALALLDDGSVCRVRGTLAVDSFRDKLWALERRSDVGQFFQVDRKLRFKRGTGYGKALAPLVLGLSFFLVPLIPPLMIIVNFYLYWTCMRSGAGFFRLAYPFVAAIFSPFVFCWTIDLTIILFFLGAASAFWRLKAGVFVRPNSIVEERRRFIRNRLRSVSIFVFLVVEFLVLLTAAAASAMFVEACASSPDFVGFSIIVGILFIAATGVPLPTRFYLLIASILGFA